MPVDHREHSPAHVRDAQVFAEVVAGDNGLVIVGGEELVEHVRDGVVAGDEIEGHAAQAYRRARAEVAPSPDVGGREVDADLPVRLLHVVDDARVFTLPVHGDRG